jgi:hypothetical protein
MHPFDHRPFLFACQGAWWEVDLGDAVSVARVIIYNQISDYYESSQLSDALVSLRDTQGNTLKTYEIGDAAGMSVFNISFDSYLGQTSAPTPSPTVFTPCNGMTVEIKVKTDYFPEEIGWTLVNKCGANVTLRSSPYSLPNTMQSIAACLPLSKYKFTITDAVGDGFGLGGYEILVDGNTVYAGAHDGVFDSFYFGACPIGDSYLGCYIGELADVSELNLDVNGKSTCIRACFNSGYQYAGTKNATECWCGNTTMNFYIDTNTINGCNMPCKGNVPETCGGRWHSSVYNISATLVHKIRIELEGLNHLHMREVQVFDQNNINRALNKRATQSSTSVDCGAVNSALNAVNGDLADMSHTLFESGELFVSVPNLLLNSYLIHHST